MGYQGTAHNDSAVIVYNTGADLTGKEFHGVKLNAEGKLVLAGAGEAALGILSAEQGFDLTTGNRADVQIKDIGLGKAGAKFVAGDFLAMDGEGRFIKAEAGAFVVAYAIEAANAADEIVSIQIVRAGAKA